ncbi:type II toxin-antitoxin system RelE/ParE family toxin [Porticoccus sp. GXU_MW_L64]
MMATYELSPQAEIDLFQIAIYTLDNFGLAQSEHYREKLEKRFQEVADNPKQWPTFDEIRKGYRRSVCGSHSIYYREKATFVEIMRVYGR